MSTRITVSGNPAVDAGPDTPLLYVLRNDLGLNGPKFGCGLGQWGLRYDSCGNFRDLLDASRTLERSRDHA